MRLTVDTRLTVRTRLPARMRLPAALLAAVQLTSACFTYVPPRTAPQPGAPVQVELTDPGRVTHSAALGPGILRLAGTVRGMDGERVRVDVASVTPIRGPELPVSGIQVALAPADIADLRVRTLSRTRTAWVVGTAVAAVVAFLVTEGFRAGYTPPEGPPGGGGPDQWRGSATVSCCH